LGDLDWDNIFVIYTDGRLAGNPVPELENFLNNSLIQGCDEKLNSEIGAMQSNSITMLKNELQNGNLKGVNDHPHSGWLEFSVISRKGKSTSVL
jgi:hypothetical protein